MLTTVLDLLGMASRSFVAFAALLWWPAALASPGVRAWLHRGGWPGEPVLQATGSTDATCLHPRLSSKGSPGR